MKRWSIILGYLIGLQVIADDASMQRCLDQAQTTIDMRKCTAQELGYQDFLLNKVYKRVMAKLSPLHRKELRDVQRAWIRYRDLKCDFETIVAEGGSMVAVLALDCNLEMTKQRRKELEYILRMTVE